MRKNKGETSEGRISIKIVNSGKAAGVVASSPDSIKHWIELGVKFITCHQTMILTEALGNFVNSFNKVIHD
jgi:2-keto-3-deoxy-L-rhamnonate aldolase RhmA